MPRPTVDKNPVDSKQFVMLAARSLVYC